MLNLKPFHYGNTFQRVLTNRQGVAREPPAQTLARLALISGLARKVVSSDKRNIAFIQNDGETIPVGNQKVDAVFADALFLHIPHQVTLSYFDEIARVLRPGGYFLSKVKRAGYYPHLLAVSTQFTETELNHILSVRFKTVEIAPDGDEFSVKCRTKYEEADGAC